LLDYSWRVYIIGGVMQYHTKNTLTLAGLFVAAYSVTAFAIVAIVLLIGAIL
jgi:hypothetical protein